MITRETEKFYPDKLTPIGLGKIVERYQGAKKRMYYKAMTRLKEEGYKERYGAVRMFVKNERFPDEDIVRKPPRAIQYRSPEFNLMFMKYTIPFEEHYYESLNYGSASGTRVIAKGLNPAQRGELFLEKLKYFKTPVFTMLDYTAYDSTILKEHIKSTHRKYEKAFGKGTLRWIQKQQCNNKGRTRHGIRYKVEGTRMSGDADTGLGNTIINCDSIYGALKLAGVEKYDWLCDGDDAVIITEKKVELSFKENGFIAKLSYTTDVHQVEFCQSRIVLTPEPIFVRHPRKIMSSTAMCRVPYGKYNGWLAAVGMCEAACNPGVPINQAFGEKLMKLPYRKMIMDRDVKRRMEGSVVKHKDVTQIARLTYYLAFGVPPPVQEMLEQQITSDDKNYNYDNKDDESLRRTWTWSQLSSEFGSCGWWCGG
nr:MAG: RNA-dependent RNA polymerase [Riboviria sp.]